MPTTGVRVANFRRRHLFFPGQGIDDRRFSRAGTPQEHSRKAWGQEPGQGVHAKSGPCGHHQHFNTTQGLGEVRLGDRSLCCQVRLGQNHHRSHTALQGHGQIALQPTWIEIRIQRGHQECQVHICGDGLHRLGLTRRAADEEAGPW